MSKKLENMVVFIIKHKQSNSKPIFSFLPWISKNHSWYFLGKISTKINEVIHRFAWSAAKQGTFLNIYVKPPLLCILWECYIWGQMRLTLGCWKWCLERMRSTYHYEFGLETFWLAAAHKPWLLCVTDTYVYNEVMRRLQSALNWHFLCRMELIQTCHFQLVGCSEYHVLFSSQDTKQCNFQNNSQCSFV